MPSPPRAAPPSGCHEVLGCLPLLSASASLATLVHARSRASLPPAGRLHTQSNGAGLCGREMGVAAGRNSKKDPLRVWDLGVGGGCSGGRYQGVRPARTLCSISWGHPITTLCTGSGSPQVLHWYRPAQNFSNCKPSLAAHKEQVSHITGPRSHYRRPLGHSIPGGAQAGAWRRRGGPHNGWTAFFPDGLPDLSHKLQRNALHFWRHMSLVWPTSTHQPVPSLTGVSQKLKKNWGTSSFTSL